MNSWAIAFGVAVVALIVLIALIIARVFHPEVRLPSGHGLPMYGATEMGLYNTTVKCRSKYPNHPLAFGNDVINKKGCFSCPSGYILNSDTMLNSKDYSEIRCERTEFKPAKVSKTDKRILSCLDYNNDTDRVYPAEPYPKKGLNPWETIQPYACKINKNYRTDYKKAINLGPV